MGNRERFEHHASVARNRLELVEQARLANAGVARRGEHLSMTGANQFQRLLHAVELTAAAAEFRKSAHRRRLEPCAQLPEAVKQGSWCVRLVYIRLCVHQSESSEPPPRRC